MKYLGLSVLMLAHFLSFANTDNNTSLKAGWYIHNNTHHTIHSAWYRTKIAGLFTKTPWGDKHQYTGPIAIEPQEKVFMPCPTEAGIWDTYATRLQLMVTHHHELLSETIGADKHGACLNPEHAHMLFVFPQEELPKPDNSLVVFDQQSGTHTIELLKETGCVIRLINTTNDSLHCAFYYIEEQGAEKCRTSDLIATLPPHLSKPLHYPCKSSGKTIKLCVAREDQKSLLSKSRLSKEEMPALTWKDFSKVNLFQWYLQREFEIRVDVTQPHGLRVASVGGGAFERLAKKTHDISEFEAALITECEEHFKNNAPLYRAHIPEENILITNKELLVKEQQFVAQRSEFARQAINKLLGEELIPYGAPVPKIALVFTGGGYRAMIETIGFLRGAAKEDGGNIFDCALYMMGLSGSTWAINPLVVSGMNPATFSAEQRTKVGKSGLISLTTLISELTTKSRSYIERRFIESRYGKFHGTVGIYGHALAHALLSGFTLNNKTAHHMALSDMQSNLAGTPYPLPVSVAIEPGTREEERLWYEFSPYYIGTHQERGAWIDARFFGSTFKNGSLIHAVPEYPLGHYLGMWGSAFALSVADISKESPVLGFLLKGAHTVSTGVRKAYSYLLNKEQKESASCGRTTGTEIPNFNYGYSSVLSGLRKKPVLCLIDGGITKEGEHRHNFASVPALWRQADILIMCDSIDCPNADTHCEHLRGSDEEARRLRLAFPNITRSTLHKKKIKQAARETSSLFIEDGAPIVVYMKAKRNKTYDSWLAAHNDDPALVKSGFDPDASVTRWTATSNFSYTPEQFDLLSGLTESIFVQSKEMIKEAIKKAIERKI